MAQKRDAMDEPETNEKPSRPRRVRRRFSRVRLLAATFTLLSLLFLVSVGAIFVALKTGPVSLKLVEQQIADELRKQSSDTPIAFHRAQLTLEAPRGDGLPQRVLVELLELTVRNSEGHIAIHTPRLAAAINLPDLYQGDWSLDELIVDNIFATVVRDADGRLTIGGGAADPQEGDIEPSANILSLLGYGAENGEGTVHKVLLNDATIIYRDEITGRLLRASDVDIFLSSLNDNYQASLELDLDGGVFGRQTLALQAFLGQDQSVTIAADFSNIDLRDIASQVQALDWLGQLAAPVAGQFELAFDPDGKIIALEGNLDSGAGKLTSADWAEPINGAGFEFIYDADTERFFMERLHLLTDTLDLGGAGIIEITRDDDGETEAFTAQLTLDSVGINRPEVWDEPVFVEHADITGRLNVYPLRLDIGEAYLSIGDARFSGAGVIRREAGGWLADIEAEAKNAGLSQVLSHWPNGVSPQTKGEILNRVNGATFPDANIAVRLSKDDLKVDLSFLFEQSTIEYLQGLPPVSGASGTGRLSEEFFAMDLSEGVIEMPDGSIDISGTRFQIDNLDSDNEIARVAIRSSGPATSSLALAAMEPLNVSPPASTPIVIAGGTAKTEIVFDVPLDVPMAEADIDPLVSAVVNDARVVIGEENLELSSPKISVAYQDGSIDLSGKGRLDQNPIVFDLNSDVRGETQVISATGEADRTLLEKLGLSADWFRDGAIIYDAKLTAKNGSNVADLALQMTNSEIALPVVGYLKLIGENLNVSARVQENSAETVLSGLSVEGVNASAIGDVRLNSNGDFVSASLSELEVQNLFKGAVTVERKETHWESDVQAQFLDLGKVQEFLDGEGSLGAAGQDLKAQVNFDVSRLQATDTIHISSAKGGLVLGGDKVDLNLSGLIGGDAPGVITYQKANGATSLYVTSDNAGQVLRAAGFFDNGSGGKMRLRIESDDREPGIDNGRLHIDDLVIHEDAKLEQIMIGAERRDLRTKLAEDGISFKKVRAPFQIRDQIVFVKDAYARGTGIGLSIEGEYRIEEGELDMDGVFTPFYALNGAVNNVPILGTLLTGGDGQGLLAFNYSVKGKAEDPDVRVNPLSVLAPGILKKILSGGGDTTPVENETPDR
ncbi:MAG: AsmA-like C-terminal domain-containing protein [Pikeienuella sp.]